MVGKSFATSDRIMGDDPVRNMVVGHCSLQQQYFGARYTYCTGKNPARTAVGKPWDASKKIHRVRLGNVVSDA